MLYSIRFGLSTDNFINLGVVTPSMDKQKDSNLEVMTHGMKFAIDHSASNIETVTTKLNSHFDGLNADKLPEYKTAIDAIKAYQEALVAHFVKKYNESDS